MKISKVYTRTGDKGTTSLVGGVRVKKTNPRIEAYGTIDELSANLGLLIDYMKEGDERKFIVRIQHNLFVIGSYLATDQTKTELREFCMIDPTETEALEEAIDEALLNIPPLSGFILPGGCMAAAWHISAAQFAVEQREEYSPWAKIPRYRPKSSSTSTDCPITSSSLHAS